jgi:hypothetical protein
LITVARNNIVTAHQRSGEGREEEVEGGTGIIRDSQPGTTRA